MLQDEAKYNAMRLRCVEARIKRTLLNGRKEGKKKRGRKEEERQERRRKVGKKLGREIGRKKEGRIVRKRGKEK